MGEYSVLIIVMPHAYTYHLGLSIVVAYTQEKIMTRINPLLEFIILPSTI